MPHQPGLPPEGLLPQGHQELLCNHGGISYFVHVGRLWSCVRASAPMMMSWQAACNLLTMLDAVSH